MLAENWGPGMRFPVWPLVKVDSRDLAVLVMHLSNTQQLATGHRLLLQMRFSLFCQMYRRNGMPTLIIYYVHD